MFRTKVIKECSADSYPMPYLEGLSQGKAGKAHPVKINPEEIERQAFEKGYASGEKAGYEMGKQKAGLLITDLENLFKKINSLKEKQLSELEPQVVLLAVAMARKILKEELSLHPEIIEKMVKEAINKISRTDPITIKLNRSLYELFMEKKSEFLELSSDLNFKLDNNVPEGGAIVCSPSEEIQTDLEFQLSNIIDELRNHLGNA